MASTRLKRTPSSTGTRTKFTYSAWIKRGSLAYAPLMSAWSANTDAGYLSLRFPSSGELDCTGWQTAWFNTNRKFRDINGYFHIVLSVDSTLATAGDRMKLYVNGVQETSFTSKNNPSQNQEFPFSHSGTPHFIGVQFYAGSTYSHYYDGSMSHVHFIDGTAYDASAFGSTDSTTGEWKINTSPSVTYGTNGFFILKDGNSVTDQSGQSNNLTVDSGTLTKTEDCPSNVFATGNPLIKGTNGNSNGNLRTTSGQNSWESMWTTLGASSGKFYAEFKRNSSSYTMFGVRKTENITTFDEITGAAGGVGWQSHGSIYNNNSETESGGSPYATYADGDIIGVAMDLDNSKLYFHKNGTYQNSGVPTSGSTGTGAISLTANAIYHFGFCAYNGSCDANFGNGYFGTTIVSSAQNPDDGNGIFQYQPPTGYTALCTKGLNL